ncbi:hypothetical protein Goari_007606 [Gossypium aridum]|uniref:Uncharacterized protein n=1 Tax=Gossypium aridum TaxID=34290 RepID=A0A7J8XS74_GOSAI|nr:hypothetical protein [Gossypium aridum]
MTLIGFDFADVQTAIAAKETCIEQLMIPSQPSAGYGASAVPAIDATNDSRDYANARLGSRTTTSFDCASF